MSRIAISTGLFAVFLGCGCSSLLGFEDVTLATNDAGPGGRIDGGPDPALCGNSAEDPGETCDDGNNESGDGCSAACLDETVFCAPAEVGTGYSFASIPGRIVADGDYLYVADSPNVSNPTLRVLNVADPANISEVGTFQHDSGDYPNSRTTGIVKRGDFLWLAGREPGLISLDVSDPGEPSLGELQLNPDTDGHLALLGSNHLLVSTSVSERPTAYNVSTNVDATFVSALGNQATVYFNVGTSAQHAFAVTGAIVHISDSVDDPANSSVIGAYTHPSNLGSDTERIVANQSVLAVAVSGIVSPGVHLVDISIPNAPNFARTIPGSAPDLALAGDFIYVPKPDGLEVHDIRDPSEPVLAGSIVDFAFGSTSIAVDVDRGRAYLVGDGPLKVLEGLPGICNSVCGNNQLEYPEDCDDGNLDDGDGCEADCTEP